MKRRPYSISVLVVLAALACAPRAPGRLGPEWVLLGQRQVTDRIDHDVIPVTAARGRFRRIKLTVRRASVDFYHVVVHYGNGSNEELELRHTIPAGGESRVIDLAGGDRVIQSIEFVYDANTLRRYRAVVRVYGLP